MPKYLDRVFLLQELIPEVSRNLMVNMFVYKEIVPNYEWLIIDVSLRFSQHHIPCHGAKIDLDKLINVNQ